MRIFNTVQELWSFCSFCPLCREHSRTITLQVGPDDEFNLSDNLPYEKIGSELKLYASYQMERGGLDYIKGRISATYLINCDTNDFELQVSDINLSLAEKAKRANFYFYVYSKCHKCDNSYINSSDVEFDLENKKVYHIQMDREGYYLQDKYHVTVSHEQNMLMVSRLEMTEDARIDHEKVIELPYVNLDLSDIPKVVNKIKTLILFS